MQKINPPQEPYLWRLSRNSSFCFGPTPILRKKKIISLFSHIYRSISLKVCSEQMANPTADLTKAIREQEMANNVDIDIG